MNRRGKGSRTSHVGPWSMGTWILVCLVLVWGGFLLGRFWAPHEAQAQTEGRQFFLAIGTPEAHSIWHRVSAGHPWRFNEDAELQWRIFEGPDLESAVQHGGGVLLATIHVTQPRPGKGPEVHETGGDQ